MSKEYTITGNNVNYTFNIANSFSKDEESWILITEEIKTKMSDNIEILKEIKDFDNTVYRIKL